MSTKKKAKAKEFVAWAVFDHEGGPLSTWDYRLPICWLKGLARDDAERFTTNGVVRKVRITIEESR